MDTHASLPLVAPRITPALDQDAYYLVDASLNWTSGDGRYRIGVTGRNLTDARYRVGGYNFLNATINDVSDLREYFTNIYHDGYFPPRNHAWKMQSLRNDSAVKEQLTNIFQRRA